jgi:hypothetical protein
MNGIKHFSLLLTATKRTSVGPWQDFLVQSKGESPKTTQLNAHSMGKLYPFLAIGQ